MMGVGKSAQLCSCLLSALALVAQVRRYPSCNTLQALMYVNKTSLPAVTLKTPLPSPPPPPPSPLGWAFSSLETPTPPPDQETICSAECLYKGHPCGTDYVLRQCSFSPPPSPPFLSLPSQSQPQPHPPAWETLISAGGLHMRGRQCCAHDDSRR